MKVITKFTIKMSIDTATPITTSLNILKQSNLEFFGFFFHKLTSNH